MNDYIPGGAPLQHRRDVVREALVDALARVAQKACRNGEAGDRVWPSLRQLPLLESWKCVGETYVDEVMATMMSALLATPDASKPEGT